MKKSQATNRKAIHAPSTTSSALSRDGGVESPAPALDRWLECLSHSATPISSNQSAVQMPFQRWFKFKEAFSPQFIVDCVSMLPKRPRSCIDPFGGSGTSALTCQFLGIHPTTIEVNPFLADIIEAKLSNYDTQLLSSDYLGVLKRSTELSPSPRKLLKDAPATLVEPGVNGRWVYTKPVAKQILALREAIDLVESDQNRKLLKILLGSILVPLSNIIVNGKGRRYRNDWQNRQKAKADVEPSFRRAFFDAFSDICRFADRPCRKFDLIRGDSRAAIDAAERVDFAVLSPPYPNSFDYTDIYNVELWALGYLGIRSDDHNLRRNTLRSHVQIQRDYEVDTLESKVLAKAYRALCNARPELWNPNIPEMICAYFADMRTVISKLKSRLNRGGKVFLAVGNSQYAGVTIDVETILKDIALAHGFRHATSTAIRSMRASAQQGGRHQLTESLIVLT